MSNTSYIHGATSHFPHLVAANDGTDATVVGQKLCFVTRDTHFS